MRKVRSRLVNFRLARDPSWAALTEQSLRALYHRLYPQEPVPKRPQIPVLHRKQAQRQ